MEDDNTNFFLYNSSLNTCRKQIKERYSQFTKSYIVKTFKYLNNDVYLFQLDDILDKKISLALVELPQILPSNRLPNANFLVLIKKEDPDKASWWHYHMHLW